MTPRLSDAAIPRGFSFSSMACGLKRYGPDLALLVSEAATSAACVFTTNMVQAAPVIVSREHLRRSGGRARAVIVNSGNANCATGPTGLVAARNTAAKLAHELGCQAEEILVCSTGVIGAPLRVERILRAVPELVKKRSGSATSFLKLSRAIMTTDTRPKWASARCRIRGKQVRLAGCAKGAGMIQPNMATMLSFIATDATIRPALLRRALREAVRGTFNAITVDGDTSTNDTVAMLANGASGAPAIRTGSGEYRAFRTALESVCRALALAIVADGEGAKRVIEIEVRGASSDAAAERIARTIANSPLVKTAFAGADPNWGRILAAAGRAGVKFNPERTDVYLAGMLVCHRGREHRFNERAAHRKMLASHVPVVVDLRAGCGRARVWTCDFTGEYVTINASYRT
jgi:glutamate N-acetyltransferase / amino-acid N-acetyltransferase